MKKSKHSRLGQCCKITTKTTKVAEKQTAPHVL